MDYEEKFEKIITRLDRLTKELCRQRRDGERTIEEEAKEILKTYLEQARSEFNDDFESPEDDPKELDLSNKRDKLIQRCMTKHINGFIDALTNCDDDTESEEENDSESDEEQSYSYNNYPGMMPTISENGQQQGSGRQGRYI